MGRVVHFEIPFANVDVIRNFYTNVFNWTFTKWEGPEDYWLVTTGKENEPGIGGGLIPVMADMGATKGMINTIDVDDLDQTLARVMANGGTEIMPKSPVPGVGWLAYVRDPEGTVIGMMQADPGAHM
jgi:predicted enzyme related to lactoylglutathione lyase